MILPIVTYGASVLRKPTKVVEKNSDELQDLIDNMIETMHGASGVGLAAPQVGRNERLFVVDLSAVKADEEDSESDREEEQKHDLSDLPVEPLVFINPELDFLEGADVDFEEGCLSIPEIREDVRRPEAVSIRFLDRNFEPNELELEGLLARVVQHEFDHLEGVLFVDRLSPLKKRLLRRRLREMSRGEVTADYPIVTAADKAWQASGSIS